MAIFKGNPLNMSDTQLANVMLEQIFPAPRVNNDARTFSSRDLIPMPGHANSHVRMSGATFHAKSVSLHKNKLYRKVRAPIPDRFCVFPG